jgi:hypothetical protein
MIEDVAGWVAPIATAIAAVMTAANLGARVTGWGFVVFTVGSIGWCMVGLTSGQTNLLATNAFLTLVNALGIWRWLGRQANYEKTGAAATDASRKAPSVPTQRSATALAGAEVTHRDGSPAGKLIEMMLDCDSAAIAYLVVATGGVGGVGETLKAVPPGQWQLGADSIKLGIDAPAFAALPDWTPEEAKRKAGC